MKNSTSLTSGSFVVQYHRGSHRYGVISKKIGIDESNWAFFKVVWPSGDSSILRADQLKTCSDPNSLIEDLLMLRKQQDLYNEDSFKENIRC